MNETKFRGLVLAAGRGSRFASESGDPFPKVLRPVLGRPMVFHVLDALRGAGIENITLIVGFSADDVRRIVGEDVEYAFQTEQRGSGHAVACAAGSFQQFDGSLIVMCGDSPLFTSDTVRAVMSEHIQSRAVITLASAVLENPYGYGRILRDAKGTILGIVEEKCANAEQRAIREVNGGAYAFDSRWLFDNIGLMAINEAGEYNLTDMVRVAIEQGRTVSAVNCDSRELLGVNTPAQLENVEAILRSRSTEFYQLM